ncbi:ubiE/COQ5 methyltransferase [Mytilinidion resinicola]|uniref:Arsenite methyltransferase n=1 Tax=Mytilinidion resinicola TaxID=574789 RepID=A0A6A6YU98_9PEZI|nr:ubiE/COQ5 methyltransferase [Mytilinidion resinicola]KAF2811963.1 ubiE/COQ5 methyltransferase [Mytilinidion resinicola]
MDPQTIHTAVQSRYGTAALSPTSPNSTSIATAFGYTPAELSSIPSDANLGLSCGNPLALAALSPGETVIDLGSGAGFDVFLAAKRVGPTGRAIGVDMNEAMLARANRNLSTLSPTPTNISFIHANITAIPLDKGIADCIISNCVINLVPTPFKPLVFAEIHRLLKPGGRVAVSDILARKPLRQELKESMALYVGCVAGAEEVGAYEGWLRGVGFDDVLIVDAWNDLNLYKSSAEKEKGGCCVEGESAGTEKEECCGSCCGNGSGEEKGKKCCDIADCCHKKECCDLVRCGGGEKKDSCRGSGDDDGVLKEMAVNHDFNEWAGSFKIYAVKP